MPMKVDRYWSKNEKQMVKQSAGILLYCLKQKEPEVLLVHPGGPFWAKKDFGAWTIPKGEINDDETAKEAVRREAFEEIGLKVEGDMIELTPIKYQNGKKIIAWAVQGNFNPSEFKSNTFEMKWPPKSTELKTFPEIDRADWFTMRDAKLKILKAQLPLLEELEKLFYFS